MPVCVGMHTPVGGCADVEERVTLCLANQKERAFLHSVWCCLLTTPPQIIKFPYSKNF